MRKLMAVAVGAVVSAALVLAPGVRGAPVDWKTTPWAEPQDTEMATFAPDEYAWRLFVALNWPAVADGCGPDKARKLGDAGQRVWERWALKGNVYLPKAKEPADWPAQCASGAAEKVLTPTALVAASAEQRAVKSPHAGPTAKFVQPGGDASNANDEEVRMNEATFRFIHDNKLYDRDVLKAMAASGRATLDFPHPAKEIKAHWIVLTDPADVGRYYTAVSKGKTYGLVALSITSKDLPRWFWATFEHVDNQTRWPAALPAAFAGWKDVPPRDTYACAAQPASCGAAPKGIGLEGTVWANYRLKATQVDWVDSFGEPTHVVNSKIEGTFVQTKSSCMSCHALAMAGSGASGSIPFSLTDDRLPPDPGGRDISFVGVVGKAEHLAAPPPAPDEKFMQLDFVWSLRNAKSK